MGGAFYARAFDSRSFFVGVLLTTSAITVATVGTLGAPQPLLSQSTVAVATTVDLRAPVTFATSTGVSVGDTGDLSTFTGIRGSAGLTISTDVRTVAPLEITLESGAGAWYFVAFYPRAFGSAHSYAGVAVGSASSLTAPVVVRADVGLALGTTAFVSMPSPLASVGSHLNLNTSGFLVVVGISASDPILAINGQPLQARVGSVVIRDLVNEQVNTFQCTIDAPNVPPVAGNDLRLGLGSLAGDRLIFAGVVQSVEQTFTLTPDHPAWNVRAVDYGVLFNRRQVWCSYTNVSATLVAQQLVATYSSGFTVTHIAAGLPPITLNIDSGTLSAALTEIANLIGGYWYVDYVKDVHLFISESNPATDPHPLDGTPPAPLGEPILSMTTDNSQRRTRILVVGIAVGVLAPVRAGATEIPIETAQPFAGAAGYGQFGSDGTRAHYTSTAAGEASGLLVGNVPSPPGAPSAALSPDVAGQLSGWYQWAVAFGTASGETPVGPRTPLLFAPDFPTPSGGVPGLGPTGVVGPLVGFYAWAVSFVTSLGETLVGPTVVRTTTGVTAPALNVLFGPSAISRLGVGTYTWYLTYLTQYGETLAGPGVTSALTDLAVPIGFSVSTASAGPLAVGIATGYCATFVSQDGETTGGAVVPYTPPAFTGPSLSSQGAIPHGGLYGGPYSYAVSIVTAAGESALTGSIFLSTQSTPFTTAGPQTAPSWTGSQDTTGRIQPQYTYYYAASFFSDQYGETPLSYANSINVGGSYPLRLLMNVPSLQTGADGIRIYRAQANGPFTLNAEFRRSSGVPSQYWDYLAQGEQGGTYPVQSLKAGVQIALSLGASPEPGVVARRIYRTKANGAEWFLVGEVQSNNPVTFTDVAFDQNLTTRNPVTNLAGRTAALSGIPTGPVGTLSRRIYRAKTGAYYLVGELKDNTSSTWQDGVPDSALSVAIPGRNTAGSRYGGFQPVLQVPVGPSGVIGRRIYRTLVNGSAPRLAIEIPNNTATTVLDDVPDSALGATNIPAVSTAGGEQVVLSSIPIGPTGTLARRIYRTVAGGSDLRQVMQLNNNTTTSVVDAVADRDLGSSPPLRSTAGSSAVVVSNLPIGPSGVTRRLLYRTAAGKTDLQYVATIADNTTLTFTDARADTSLGKPPEPTSTIGALTGSTTLTLSSVAGFPSAGWIDVGGLMIYYAGLSGTSLVGIPPMLTATITRAGTVATMSVGGHNWTTGDTVVVTGATQSEYNGAHLVTVLNGGQATFVVSGTPVTPATTTTTIQAGLSGAITRPIDGGAVATTVPMLTGVTGVTVPHQDHDTIALLVIVDDLAAQANLAAAEGGDGIHEAPVRDETLETVAACTARGRAELALFAWPQVEMTYATFDPYTRSGRTIQVNLPALGMVATLKILEVTIDTIGVADHLYPRCVAKASTAKFSLTDLLRHVVLDV
jgi:hypothetical protein